MKLASSGHPPLSRELTAAQLQIVEWDEDALVVIAGAGGVSGNSPAVTSRQDNFPQEAAFRPSGPPRVWSWRRH
jgi:hypothetical protein